MKILLVHNYYQQSGGEDNIYRSERALLEGSGNQILTYERNNKEIAQYSAIRNMSLFGETLWSKESYSQVKELIDKERPQVAHFHNTFPLISPSAYYACQESGVPVIQTLHNYRLLCSNALFYRDNHICEECLGKTPPWPGLVHGCYQESRPKTLAVVSMLTYHRWIKTWEKQVDAFIALSNFSRHKLIEGGLSSEKITVKPNFVFPDPGYEQKTGSYGIVVGRLSREKGIEVVLNAWMNYKNYPLKIVGDGPLMEAIEQKIKSSNGNQIELFGWMTHENVLGLIKGSRFLIFSSLCYENFPLVIAEAYACGKPVVAPRLGVMQEIVKEGVTGILYEPGNEVDLADKIGWAFTHSEAIGDMGRNAREEFERNYSAEANYEVLMGIYDRTLKQQTV